MNLSFLQDGERADADVFNRPLHEIQNETNIQNKITGDHHLRAGTDGQILSLHFDGSDRIFVEADNGVWKMSNYNTDWTGVNYPTCSGINAWINISIIGTNGSIEVQGYNSDSSFRRRLLAGVWQSWVEFKDSSSTESNHEVAGEAV